MVRCRWLRGLTGRSVDGDPLGCIDGWPEGRRRCNDGRLDGSDVGCVAGFLLGYVVGCPVGGVVGCIEVRPVGCVDGIIEGCPDG